MAKRAFIDALLRSVPALSPIAEAPKPSSEAAFNKFFMGRTGERITRDIASPALWSVQSLHDNFGATPAVFLELCKLKWSFHIKPDLVIDIPGLPPICVEAKLESGESSYPTGKEATVIDALFGQRTRVRQFELQQFMFATLMGRPSLPVVIQKLYPERQQDSPTLIWGEVFARLAAVGCLDAAIPFVTRLLDENRTLLSSYAAHRLGGGG